MRAHSRARMPHLRAGSCVHKNVCANASIAALPNATRPSGLRAAMRPVELCIFRGDTIAAGAEVQDSPGWFGILCPAATHPYYFLPLPLSPPSPRSHTPAHTVASLGPPRPPQAVRLPPLALTFGCVYSVLARSKTVLSLSTHDGAGAFSLPHCISQCQELSEHLEWERPAFVLR